MAMKTDLKVVKAQIIGGREIDTVLVETTNQSLSNVLSPMSKCLLWMLECDSNNTTRTIVPRDVRTILGMIEFFKTEQAQAKKHKDQPMGVLEVQYKILLPSPVEMKKFPNMLIERVALQIYNVCRICISVDSKGTKNFIHSKDFKLLDEAVVVLDDTILKYLGDGKDVEPYDVPDLMELGQVVPDTDMDAAEFREPSADRPTLGMPDTKDTPSGSPT